MQWVGEVGRAQRRVAGGVCWLQVVVRREAVVGLLCVRVRGGVVTWGGLVG